MAEVQVVGFGASSGLVNLIERAPANVPKGHLPMPDELAPCKADDNAGAGAALKKPSWTHTKLAPAKSKARPQCKPRSLSTHT